MYKMFAAVALLTFAGLTHADDMVDWKIYSLTGDAKEALFYLSSDIVRTGGNVQVWMKALEVKKLDTDGSLKNEEVLKKTAFLLTTAYQPPLGTVTPLTKDQVTLITAYEVMADVNLYPSKAKILYEIDCALKLIRVLSIITPTHSDSITRPWEHVPPESPPATLSKLTCKPH